MLESEKKITAKTIKNIDELFSIIRKNLVKVVNINCRIIEILGEEEAKINQVSLSQMIDVRNSIIEKSLNVIEQEGISQKEMSDNSNKSSISKILSEVAEQEVIINTLFKKQLNILRQDVIKFSNAKNINLYKRSL